MDKSSKENLIKYCDECGNDSFKEIIVDKVDNYVLETRLICRNCGNVVNYWALGYYENIFSEKYKNILRNIKLKRILEDE